MRSIVVIILLALFPYLCLADQTVESGQYSKKIYLTKTSGHSFGNHPLVADRQVITCCYDNYGMEFEFLITEGLGKLTVVDEKMQSAVYTFDTSSLDVYVPVGKLYGKIKVELETEMGNIYEGVIK